MSFFFNSKDKVKKGGGEEIVSFSHMSLSKTYNVELNNSASTKHSIIH